MTAKPYNNISIFSGGGTRFAIYCGMYAGLEDLNQKPDLIIASCGGSLATSIINAWPTDQERFNYLQSEELFEFVKSTKLTNQRLLHKIGLLSLKKIFNKQQAPFIEDVFNTYLVDSPEDLTTHLLPSLHTKMGKHVKSILIGSQMLFNKNEVNQRRNNRKLYKKILLTDAETAKNIHKCQINDDKCTYNNSAVDSDVDVLKDISMLTAMRISVSDMFYVQPVQYKNNYYAGGAIDLIPIEIAQALGTNIFVEKKKKYSTVEESLVRAVLGYSGNARLKHVEKQTIRHWIDTRDATEVLKGHYCQKSINWSKFRIDISLPKSFQQFRDDMEIQWQYGYDKITNAFRS